jgi:hypothetical protein
MNLFMTLLVRDEEDIVAANILYHLSRGVDHIIVTNNCSVDDTREILQEFERAGQITLIDEDEDDFSQFRWVTRMARLAQKMGADWVINNDADEMWWSVEGDLKSVLAAVPPAYGCVTVQRMNALPLRSLSDHPFEAMRFRDVQSVNGLGQRLPPKVAHRAVVDVCVQQGNHCVLAPSLGPSVSTSRIVISHFPYRSYPQFERRIASGGAAYLRNTALPPSVGAVWREFYERLRAGTLRVWYDELRYADDPRLAEWIAQGKVVEDTRVAVYLRRGDHLSPRATSLSGYERSPIPAWR